MTVPTGDDSVAKQNALPKGFLDDKREFAHDVSTHFVELCDACRKGDLEAVQTYFSASHADEQISFEFWSGYK
jgi:hypothetical protein